MIFDELKDRYGSYAAEMVRQALTLEEFKDLEIEELVPYFELRAEKVYQEYSLRKEDPSSHNRRVEDVEAYLEVLRRRWQEAEELAHLVLAADMAAREEEKAGAAGA
ncbi:MAG: hypothetical protein PHY92_02090 [Alphaproteobacteria bacterium]|nr:hypothetical protein [Alphaproteobacteria bacterium]